MKLYGQEAVEVEKAGGEVVAYLFAAAADPQPDDVRAFVLTRPDPDKATGLPVRHRVALTRTRGWVCDCKDWEHNARKGRAKQPGEPCCHMAAVQRHLAEQTETPAGEVPAVGGGDEGEAI